MSVDVDLKQSVLTLRVDGIEQGWQQDFLLMADVHWDNPHCERRLLKRHLDEAVERNAKVLVFGDWFCAMQGRYDPRSNKSSVRPEHQVDNYLDALVDTAAEFLEPYRENFVMISDGNHELSIKKRLETDLLERLCERVGIFHMGISGFVRFMFQGSKRTARIMYFHHGYGGGGPVTKGVIQTNRRSVYTPDATMIVTGHIHEEWMLTIPRQRISEGGIPYLDEQLHINLPTYKQEFDLAGGWHVETGKPPKPLGGAWLTFYYDPSAHSNVNFRIVRAK